MIIGVLIFILALTIMSLSQTVLQFAIAMGVLLGSASLLLGPLTGSTLVARWFDSRRGFALGIAATGTSVGGIVIPQVLGYQIAEADWRAALQALAAGVAIVVLPLAVFIIRDFPGDLGLHPDGAEAASSQAQSAGGADALTLTQVLKRSTFWLMGCSLGCLFMAYVGVLSNLHKYATNLGVDPQSATGLITTIAVAGFIGKLVLGWAADRIGLKIGLWLPIRDDPAGCEEMAECCGPDYVTQMLEGLRHWVNAADRGHLTWGIFTSRSAAGEGACEG